MWADRESKQRKQFRNEQALIKKAYDLAQQVVGEKIDLDNDYHWLVVAEKYIEVGISLHQEDIAKYRRIRSMRDQQAITQPVAQGGS